MSQGSRKSKRSQLRRCVGGWHDVDILDVKRNLNRKVWYQDFQTLRNGAEMLLTGCIARKNPRGFLYYQAELKDLQANSRVITGIEKIREITEGENDGIKTG